MVRFLRLAGAVLLLGLTLSYVAVSGAQAATSTRASTTALTTPSTGAVFMSEPGDFLGAGQNYGFPTVTFQGLRGGYPTFSVSSASSQFDVWMAAPAGQPLVLGTYTDAQRFDFRSPGFPGLDVFGDGRGCNQVVGSFTVYDATYDSNGQVVSFAAQFFDHCEGFYPALMGDISYNSTVKVPPLPATAPEPPQEAQFVSQPGDYIGGGLSYSFSVSYPFGDPNRQNPTEWQLSATPDGRDFTVFIDAAHRAPLAVGRYTGAQNCVGTATPCLDVFGDGRGCDTDTARFTIYDLSNDSLGMLKSFAAEFVFHCEGKTPALYGAMRWNSATAMPPHFVTAVTADATVGTPFSFTVRTSGLPVPSVKQGRKLPPGLHFVDNGDGTATISGTPATGTEGVYRLRVRAITASTPHPLGALQVLALVVSPVSAAARRS